MGSKAEISVSKELLRELNRVDLETRHREKVGLAFHKEQPMLIPFAPGLIGLGEDFTYNTIGVTIYTGFIFDGASIPRFFWRVIGSPFSPEFQKAALIHDYLYRTQILTRKAADKWLKYYLLESNVEKEARDGREKLWDAIRGIEKNMAEETALRKNTEGEISGIKSTLNNMQNTITQIYQLLIKNNKE